MIMPILTHSPNGGPPRRVGAKERGGKWLASIGVGSAGGSVRGVRGEKWEGRWKVEGKGEGKGKGKEERLND